MVKGTLLFNSRYWNLAELTRQALIIVHFTGKSNRAGPEKTTSSFAKVKLLTELSQYECF